MNKVKGLAGFLLGALFLFATSANATTVRTVSSYGEPINYTSAGSLGGLTAGTLFANPSNPVDGGLFNEEVLCPFSTGCASPGTDDFQLFLETLSALAPGTQITVNLGSTVTLGSFGVALITCDPNVTGAYCMATAPTAGCFSDGTSTDGSGNNLVTIDLSTAPACSSVPSTLVFSLDEDGDSATFGQVSTTSGSTTAMPEPGSFILLSLGLLSIVGLYGWRYRGQSFRGASRA
jgi:hypothetical protein